MPLTPSDRERIRKSIVDSIQVRLDNPSWDEIGDTLAEIYDDYDQDDPYSSTHADAADYMYGLYSKVRVTLEDE